MLVGDAGLAVGVRVGFPGDGDASTVTLANVASGGVALEANALMSEQADMNVANKHKITRYFIDSQPHSS